jgi:hypothetical protein
MSVGVQEQLITDGELWLYGAVLHILTQIVHVVSVEDKVELAHRSVLPQFVPISAPGVPPTYFNSFSSFAGYSALHLDSPLIYALNCSRQVI